MHNENTHSLPYHKANIYRKIPSKKSIEKLNIEHKITNKELYISET